MSDDKADIVVLWRLFASIESRRDADASSSCTASLFAGGRAKIAQKLGEEAVETAIAAVAAGPDEVRRESADLLYHLLVLWAVCGVAPAEVWAALARPHGIPGIAEKAGRGAGTSSREWEGGVAGKSGIESVAT